MIKANFVSDAYEYYSTTVPQIMDGDIDLLTNMVWSHTEGVKELCHLRSRYEDLSKIKPRHVCIVWDTLRCLTCGLFYFRHIHFVIIDVLTGVL